jgi:hypothetical protein
MLRRCLSFSWSPIAVPSLGPLLRARPGFGPARERVRPQMGILGPLHEIGREASSDGRDRVPADGRRQAAGAGGWTCGGRRSVSSAGPWERQWPRRRHPKPAGRERRDRL